jgi:crotonobetainyl-CoA:carnitine CoA-transferase CaiB-like acyl-CoA transferase
VVAARDEKFWQNLCDAIGRPELKDDPRSANNALRVANRDHVVGILSDVFLTKGNAEWLEILDRFDIPNAPVNDMEEVFQDAQVQARGMIQTYRHPTLGEIRYPPSPIKFSEWESPNLPAPMLGEHTIAVLTERLGMEEPEVRRLASDGVVKVWPE